MTWKKGQSGNPGGKKPMSANLRKAIEEMQDATPEVVSRLRRIILTGKPREAVAGIKIWLAHVLPKPTMENPLALPEDLLNQPLAAQKAELLAKRAMLDEALGYVEGQIKQDGNGVPH